MNYAKSNQVQQHQQLSKALHEAGLITKDSGTVIYMPVGPALRKSTFDNLQSSRY